MINPIRTDWIWGTALGQEYQILLGADNRSLAVQEHVRRLDLSLSEADLKRAMTKGHRSNIKQALKNKIEIKIFDAQSIGSEIWQAFLQSHQTTESRKNRNPRCWQIMFEFIQQEHGVLVAAYYEGQWVAFAYLLIFQDRAYYAMGNTREDQRSLHPAHLIQWEAIAYLKKRGIKLYDIGTDYVNSPHTLKEDNIAKFERGFGGQIVKLIK